MRTKQPQGSNLVEYVLLIAFIAVVAIATATALKSALDSGHSGKKPVTAHPPLPPTTYHARPGEPQHPPVKGPHEGSPTPTVPANTTPSTCWVRDAFCIAFPTWSQTGIYNSHARSATGVVASQTYTTLDLMPQVIVYRSSLADPRRALIGDRTWSRNGTYTTWKGLPAVRTSSRVDAHQTLQVFKVWHKGRVYVLLDITKDGQEAITQAFFSSILFTDCQSTG